MCAGKVTYPSHREAAVALKTVKYRSSRSKGNGTLPVRVYKCDDCGGHHLTSKVKWERWQ